MQLQAGASIQIKTDQASVQARLLGRKVDEPIAYKPFDLYVNLDGRGAPIFHVVESAIVAENSHRTHREWLAQG